MEKIKCPHCGAINQDVTEQDTCWQCQQPLSASATISPSASETDAGGQRLKTQPTLEERVALRKQERATQRRARSAVPVVIALALLLIALLLYFFVFRHGK